MTSSPVFSFGVLWKPSWEGKLELGVGHQHPSGPPSWLSGAASQADVCQPSWTSWADHPCTACQVIVTDVHRQIQSRKSPLLFWNKYLLVQSKLFKQLLTITPLHHIHYEVLSLIGGCCVFETLSCLSHMSHRFLFTDYNRLSSVGGETSMAEMIATLSDACEREFGFMATRLFRVFKNDEIQGDISVFGFVSHVITSSASIHKLRQTVLWCLS